MVILYNPWIRLTKCHVYEWSMLRLVKMLLQHRFWLIYAYANSNSLRGPRIEAEEAGTTDRISDAEED